SWGEKADASTADLSTWWTVFNDEALNRLVDRAVRGNHDLAIAARRVAESRAQMGVVVGSLLPEIDLTASHSHSRISPNAHPLPITQVNHSRYHLGFDASWEIDLFGGVQRAYEA